MLTGLLAALLVATTALVITIWRGERRLDQLVASPWPSSPPRVSVIVAARNEAHTIEPAMQSLLAQKGLHPDSEVIAVNDRSDDETGSVLERMATHDSRLRVLTVATLPSDWLGKNHALWHGAEQANGDWLLFTDADVVMAPEAVARGVGYAESHQLQHVTAVPRVRASSPVLRILVIQFAISFLCFLRPWRMADSQRFYAGIGAFNLVDGATYRQVDGHRAIALTPLDDILLGRLLRQGGARSRLLAGDQTLHVDWYPDAWSMIQALRKNGFAAFDYRLSRLVAATVLYSVMGLGPWLALLAPQTLTQLLAALVLSVGIGLQAWFAVRSGWPWQTALLAPVGIILMIWAWWRAAILTLWHDGIEWRGTHYPLAQLRAHHEQIMGRKAKE